jgi:hypothetical protein
MDVVCESYRILTDFPNRQKVNCSKGDVASYEVEMWKGRLDTWNMLKVTRGSVIIVHVAVD